MINMYMCVFYHYIIGSENTKAQQPFEEICVEIDVTTHYQPEDIGSKT